MRETQVLFLSRYLVKGVSVRNGRGPGPKKFPHFGPPLKLTDKVSEKGGAGKGTGACLSEITTLLACLKDNEYNEKFCLKEAVTLRTCEETYKESIEKEQKERKAGILIPYAKRLSCYQLNKLLAKYPQPK